MTSVCTSSFEQNCTKPSSKHTNSFKSSTTKNVKKYGLSNMDVRLQESLTYKAFLSQPEEIVSQQQSIAHTIVQLYIKLQYVGVNDFIDVIREVSEEYEKLVYLVGDTFSLEEDVSKYDELIHTFYILDDDTISWSKVSLMMLFNILEYYYPCKIVYYILNFPFEIFFRSSYFLQLKNPQPTLTLLSTHVDYLKCMYDILLKYRIGPFVHDASVEATQEFIKNKILRLMASHKAVSKASSTTISKEDLETINKYQANMCDEM